MYDEKMIEDSLAFAEEIRAKLEGRRNAAPPVNNMAQGQQRAASQPRPVQGQQSPIGGQVVPPPVQQRMASRPRPLPGQQAQGQALQSRPYSQSRPLQGQPVPRGGQVVPPPAQQRMASQTRPIQGQVVPPPLQQRMASRPRPMQIPGQALQDRSYSQPRPVQGQPVSRGGQVVPPPVQQRMAGQTHPVQGQALQPGQAVPQGAAVQARPVQGQALQPGQAVPQGAAVQARPVQGQALQPGQPAQVQNAEQIRQLDGAAQSETDKKEDNHTYEITIKLDVGSVKEKLGQLRKKLAPEPRTLEDVNAAMEENRQLQLQRQQQETGSVVQNGAQAAGRLAGAAAGSVKKLPGLLKKKKTLPVSGEGGAVDGSYADAALDGSYMDADVIVPVEGEAVSGNHLAEKISNVKESLSGTATKASGAFTNVVIVLFCLGIAFLLAMFVTGYVAHQTTVEGESMEPTLSDGDTLIIQRLSYYFHSPERYDVVVFPITNGAEGSAQEYYIKRVIGLPGETVQIIDGCVYINNEKLTNDKYALSDIMEPGIADKQVILGENQYFVMGDNRNMSTDSRNSEIGPVNKNDMIGKAWICTWPLSHFGPVKE